MLRRLSALAVGGKNALGFSKTANRIDGKADVPMDLLEFTLISPVIITLYSLQQIKMALKDKGHTVDTFRGMLGDYQKFKKLMHDEPDRKIKIKYQKTLNGLLFSLVGAVLFAILILRARL